VFSKLTMEFRRNGADGLVEQNLHQTVGRARGTRRQSNRSHCQRRRKEFSPFHDDQPPEIRVLICAGRLPESRAVAQQTQAKDKSKGKGQMAKGKSEYL
jgi:hypothetical protein